MSPAPRVTRIAGPAREPRGVEQDRLGRVGGREPRRPACRPPVGRGAQRRRGRSRRRGGRPAPRGPGRRRARRSRRPRPGRRRTRRRRPWSASRGGAGRRRSAAAGAEFPQRREGGAHLGRVVGVVVVYAGAVALPLNSSRRCTPGKSDSAAAPASESIPASSSAASAARASSTLWSPGTTSASSRRAGRTRSSKPRRRVRRRRSERPSSPRRLGGRQRRRPPRAGDELGEGRAQLGQRAPAGVVVHLDVGDDRDLGVEPQEAAVALVGLDDGPLALAPAAVGGAAVRADPRQLTADEEGRVLAERPHRPDQHAVVVVLPWVPATAIVRFAAQSSDSSRSDG